MTVPCECGNELTASHIRENGEKGVGMAGDGQFRVRCPGCNGFVFTYLNGGGDS